MRSRVCSTRKKPEVFKWTKCMEDFVYGQLVRQCPAQFVGTQIDGTTPRESKGASMLGNRGLL